MGEPMSEADTQNFIKLVCQCGCENERDAIYCKRCGNRIEQETMERFRYLPFLVEEEESVQMKMKVCPKCRLDCKLYSNHCPMCAYKFRIIGGTQQKINSENENLRLIFCKSCDKYQESDSKFCDFCANEFTSEEALESIKSTNDQQIVTTRADALKRDQPQRTKSIARKQCKKCKSPCLDNMIFCLKCAELIEKHLETKYEAAVEKSLENLDIKPLPLASNMRECPQCKTHCPKKFKLCTACNHLIKPKKSDKQHSKEKKKKQNVNIIEAGMNPIDINFGSLDFTQSREMKLELEPGMKACPQCTTHCLIDINFCVTCHHKFDTKTQNKNVTQQSEIKLDPGMKACPQCTTHCPIDINFCVTCQHKFTTQNKNVTQPREIKLEPGMKACPQCTTHCPIDINFCVTCHHKFDTKTQNKNVTQQSEIKLDPGMKACPQCTTHCPVHINFCITCNHRFANTKAPIMVASDSVVPSPSVGKKKQYKCENICRIV